jgi:hypothetical protein
LRQEAPKTPEESKKQAKPRPISSSSAVDDVDRLKEQWAFNMPCLLMINGGYKYW